MIFFFFFKWKSSLGRKDQVNLIRLRLGHCCLASNLKVEGKHVNGLCECGEVKSVLRVLLSCKLYSLQKQKLFVDLADLGMGGFFPLRTILEVGEKGVWLTGGGSIAPYGVQTAGNQKRKKKKKQQTQKKKDYNFCFYVNISQCHPTIQLTREDKPRF